VSNDEEELPEKPDNPAEGYNGPRVYRLIYGRHSDLLCAMASCEQGVCYWTWHYEYRCQGGVSVFKVTERGYEEFVVTQAIVGRE